MKSPKPASCADDAEAEETDYADAAAGKALSAAPAIPMTLTTVEARNRRRRVDVMGVDGGATNRDEFFNRTSRSKRRIEIDEI